MFNNMFSQLDVFKRNCRDIDKYDENRYIYQINHKNESLVDFKKYPFFNKNESLVEKRFRYFSNSWRNKEVLKKTKLENKKVLEVIKKLKKKKMKKTKKLKKSKKSKKMKNSKKLKRLKKSNKIKRLKGLKRFKKLKKLKKSYYLIDELWDNVLSFLGIQKIANFEQLQNINLHTLMKSYVNIHAHEKRNLIKINEEQNNKSKYSSYKKNYELMKNYIERNYNKLLKNNKLKQTLICFHIKLYVLFLSNYDTYKPLEINLKIFTSADEFYFLCEKSKHCDKEYKITYTYDVSDDIIINWIFIDWELFKKNPYAIQFKYY